MAENAINNATSNSSASSSDLEAMKQEILKEMRKEMAKMKTDIIEGEYKIVLRAIKYMQDATYFLSKDKRIKIS